jgi:hypothetical protein
MGYGSTAPSGMQRRFVLGTVAAAVILVYRLRIRPWQLFWGATEAEVKGWLPGDDLIASADLTASRAITIESPPEVVWPWIAQLGQGRGGFYSYDFLENLAGCNIHSADHVGAEWQHVLVGDEVRLAPNVALTVAAVEPGTALVLRGAIPVGKAAAPYDFTWSFVLQEHSLGSTPLLVRERYAYQRRWARLVTEPSEAVSFLMTVKMLRGIRRRAEGGRRRSQPAEHLFGDEAQREKISPRLGGGSLRRLRFRLPAPRISGRKPRACVA